jgi:hypothetical protein
MAQHGRTGSEGEGGVGQDISDGKEIAQKFGRRVEGQFAASCAPTISCSLVENSP